jgi:hypothetical protein
MAEDDKKPKTDYGSNSSKSKKEASDRPDRPEIKQIASGQVRKKSVGSKFKETFVGDSAESVGQYVLFDVILPRIKDLIFDTFTQGLERSLFGGNSVRSSRSRSQLVAKTDYKGISSGRPERVSDREISTRARATHNFEEVLIPTRGEAEQLRDTLVAIIEQYDYATVADFYNACGLTADHTDIKWGWGIGTVIDISPARGGGYIIELPRPIEIP